MSLLSHAFYDIFLHQFRPLVHLPLFFDAIHVISSDLSMRGFLVFNVYFFSCSWFAGCSSTNQGSLFYWILVFLQSHTNAFAWVAVNRVEELLELDLLRRGTNRSTTTDILFLTWGLESYRCFIWQKPWSEWAYHLLEKKPSIEQLIISSMDNNKTVLLSPLYD